MRIPPLARYFLPALLFPLAATAQKEVDFEGFPAYRISNGVLTVTVMRQGAAIASLTLEKDPRHIDPLWNPLRMARELGEKSGFAGLGHFLCLDGFGGVSPDEQKANFPFHGEAYSQQFEVTPAAASLATRAALPLVHERVSRDIRLLGNRPVLEVDTTVSSELSFDRPLQWAEHATVGSPFLETGATVVDMRAVKAKTRAYPHDNGGGLPYRLKEGEEFSWPQAPGKAGAPVDMRLTPASPNGGHTTQLMDLSRPWAWFTVLNTKSHLLLGYAFRTADFPWVQSWENYPPTGKFARGLEFSTQPFDVPRRQTVTENSLFGVPSYRWLPAKGSLTGRFYIFYTQVPESWQKIDDVSFSDQQITVRSGTASLTL